MLSGDDQQPTGCFSLIVGAAFIEEASAMGRCGSVATVVIEKFPSADGAPSCRRPATAWRVYTTQTSKKKGEKYG